MQLLLRIFSVLVIVVAVIGHDCQISKYSKECHCDVHGPKIYKMNCPHSKSANSTSFEIDYQTGRMVEITCKNNPSWSDFHFEIRNVTREVKQFILRNCSLEENTNLIEITRIVGAENATNLQFTSIYLNLRKNHLQGFPNVEKLEITETQILGDLTEDFLKPLRRVKSIILRNNTLKTIPKNFFTYVPKLQSLELDGNKIQSFDPETFKSLKDLTLLILWNNEVSELHSITFDGLVSLTSLDLHNNNFTTLPANCFDKLQKLQVVDLSESQLESLPNGLFSNLKNLECVKLHGSKLESLPEDLFKGSPEMKNISLYNNFLPNNTLPEHIFEDLVKLEKLFLSNNQIEYLHDNIFSTNKNLSELNLEHNQIKNISGSLFKGLLSLKKLNMQNNAISYIDKKAFTLMPKLEEINLSNNSISDIQFTEYNRTSIFSSLKSLEKLFLSNNKINMIFSDWTTQPPQNFTDLYLSYNEIERLIDTDLDFKQTQEFHIHLKGNKIRSINMSKYFEKTSRKEIRSTIEMFLEENPLECNCFLHDFIRYNSGDGSDASSRNLKILDINKVKCSSPKELKGTLIAKLKSEDYRCNASDLEEYNGTCPECNKWLQPFDDKLFFNCSYKNLTEAPRNMCNFTNKKYIFEVDLTGNFITNIPDMNQIGYNRVKNLVLSNNRISTIPMHVFSPALLTLKLDNNNITTLSSDVVTHLKNTTLQNITLGGNPWKCDCYARDFQHYIRSGEAKGKSQILDEDRITCQESNKELRMMKENDLCPPELKIEIIVICLAIAILGLTIGTLIALYYRYQMEIKVWLYAHQMCLCFVTEEELDKDKPYDAFISYSHKDEEFVVKELVEKLEAGPNPFKLCIHFRDWLAGEWIPTQIANSVRDSKRTIVVASPNFMQSEWGRLEFRTAHSQALNERIGRVVVILYGDIGPTDKLEPELKNYLSMNTYVKWGDPWFWDKLYYFLPHKQDSPAHLISFMKSELEQCHLNNMTPLLENAPTIEVARKISQNGNVFIDKSDDESEKLNSVC